jgi:tetratricopeptide (TPR) repeat protein
MGLERPTRAAAALLVLALALVPVCGLAQPAPPGSGPGVAGAAAGTFEARQAGVDALSARQAWEQALPPAEALARDFPQDPGAWLRLAWVRFNLGRWQESARAYTQARDLAPANPAAHLGLGWCAQRRGDLAAARAHFRETLRLAPEDPSAREGLALVGPGWSVSPALYAVAEAWQRHPEKRWSVGGVAALDAVLADFLVLGATYRQLYVEGRTAKPAGSLPTDLTQHEAWLTAGLEHPGWGLRLYGAWARYVPSYLRQGRRAWSPDTGVVALRGRVLAWAEWVGAAAWSIYDDDDVAQLALGAWLPITSWLWLYAGGQTQLTAGQSFLCGAAGARLLLGRATLELMGHLGERFRPVDLEERTVYNTQAERYPYRVGVQAGLPLGSSWAAYLGYDLTGTRLPQPSGSSRPTEARGHRGVLGLSASF